MYSSVGPHVPPCDTRMPMALHIDSDVPDDDFPPAFQQGEDAYKLGATRAENPYPVTTDEGKQWAQGYEIASLTPWVDDDRPAEPY